MSDTFKALVINQQEENFTREVKSIDKTWGSLPVGSKLAPHQPLFPRIKSN